VCTLGILQDLHIPLHTACCKREKLVTCTTVLHTASISHWAVRTAHGFLLACEMYCRQLSFMRRSKQALAWSRQRLNRRDCVIASRLHRRAWPLAFSIRRPLCSIQRSNKLPMPCMWWHSLADTLIGLVEPVVNAAKSRARSSLSIACARTTRSTEQTRSVTECFAGDVVASFAPSMLTSPQLRLVEMACILYVMLRTSWSSGLLFRLPMRRFPKLLRQYLRASF
jgi:hypothetical protein